MKLSTLEKQLMLMKIQDSMIGLRNQLNYYKNVSIEELFIEIEKINIHLTEQDIIDKYKEYMDTKKVDDYFYERDRMKWRHLDNQHTIINSDALLYLIHKIVEKHFDTETVCDPYYIMNRIDDLEETPKQLMQDKVLGIIDSVAEYGQRNHIQQVDGVLEGYDFNEVLKYYLKKCHNRDTRFKQVIKRYYDTFEDADHTIYKLK